MSHLVGLANNTKWKELQAIMSELGGRAPFWRTQATNGFVYPASGWDGDWTYHFRIGDYKSIEWCELIPRDAENSMELEELLVVCKRIGFEHEVLGNVIRLIGYRRI